MTTILITLRSYNFILKIENNLSLRLLACYFKKRKNAFFFI